MDIKLDKVDSENLEVIKALATNLLRKIANLMPEEHAVISTHYHGLAKNQIEMAVMWVRKILESQDKYSKQFKLKKGAR